MATQSKNSITYVSGLPVKADAMFTTANSSFWGYTNMWYTYGYLNVTAIPPERSLTEPNWSEQVPGWHCDIYPPDTVLRYLCHGRVSDQCFGSCHIDDGNQDVCYVAPWPLWYSGDDLEYACGYNKPYSNLTLENGIVVSPILESNANGSGTFTYWGLWPEVTIVGKNTPGNGEGLKVNSIDQYAPLGEQEWFDSATFITLRVICSYDPLVYSAHPAFQGPGPDTVMKEPIHWLSNLQEAHNGYFAMNKANACNGRVDIMTDNLSYFASGTYLFSAENWEASHTADITAFSTHEEKYQGLRDSLVGYLHIDNIGIVYGSAVLSLSTDEAQPFTVDNDKLNLTNSKLSGAAGITIEDPFDHLQECWYTEVAGVVTDTNLVSLSEYEYSGNLHESCLTLKKDTAVYGLEMTNSSVEVTAASTMVKVEHLDFGSSETILTLEDVTMLNLINYKATNLLVKATSSGSEFLGKMSFYLGFDYLFDQFDIAVTLDLGNIEAGKQSMSYHVAMLNCVFTTVPTEIILTGLNISDYTVKGEDGNYKTIPIKYLLDGVIFTNAGGINQSWNGTIVTYDLQLGDFAKKNLSFYGIPTGKMLPTALSPSGTSKLEDRVNNDHSYKNTLFGPRDAFLDEIDNKAKDTYYNPNETAIDDLELPRCDK